ncbi:MAG: PDZ domain-containing protein [Verrucomicrobia bacterium]|nr:PDZ domain-containing protein [Verrucomicrobiota bacterium]
MSFFKCLLLFVTMPTVLGAQAIPKSFLKALESEDFKARESAQSDVLSWARKNPKAALAELLRLSADASSPNPEVRERCMQVLRQLATDDFAKEGDGYLGVRMNDRMVRMPENQPDRWAVVVIEVVADSAAAKCGLKAGDAIVGLDGQTWEQEASKPFSEQIRKRKPGIRVNLRVLRDGALEDLRVELGRRPADADQLMPGMDLEEQKALEQRAKDAHFQRWLLEKKGQW